VAQFTGFRSEQIAPYVAIDHAPAIKAPDGKTTARRQAATRHMSPEVNRNVDDQDDIILADLDDGNWVQRCPGRTCMTVLREENRGNRQYPGSHATGKPYEILTEAAFAGMTIVGKISATVSCSTPSAAWPPMPMKGGMAIPTALVETGAPKQGQRMVIGTVKRDIHDIGKNLVRPDPLINKGARIRVIDLGITMPSTAILDALEAGKAQISRHVRAV